MSKFVLIIVGILFVGFLGLGFYLFSQSGEEDYDIEVVKPINEEQTFENKVEVVEEQEIIKEIVIDMSNNDCNLVCNKDGCECA